MKSNVRRSPQRSCFAIERPAAMFSPTSSMPASRERAHLLERHVLGRGEQLDLAGIAARARARGGDRARATAARLRAHPLRVERRSTAEPREAGLATGDAAVAAVGEEQLRVAARAESACGDRRRRRRRRARARVRIASGRSSRRPATCAAVPARAKRVAHLVAHLVAAGADAGPDRGARPRARASASSQSAPSAASTMPGRHAAPAAVDDRDGAAAPRARAARSRRPARAASRPGASVTCASASRELRRRLRRWAAARATCDVGAVHLTTHRDAVADRGRAPRRAAPGCARTRSGSSSVRMPRLSDSVGPVARRRRAAC